MRVDYVWRRITCFSLVVFCHHWAATIMDNLITHWLWVVAGLWLTNIWFCYGRALARHVSGWSHYGRTVFYSIILGNLVWFCIVYTRECYFYSQ
jgi:hypothetical protein